MSYYPYKGDQFFVPVPPSVDEVHPTFRGRVPPIGFDVYVKTEDRYTKNNRVYFNYVYSHFEAVEKKQC